MEAEESWSNDSTKDKLVLTKSHSDKIYNPGKIIVYHKLCVIFTLRCTLYILITVI